MPSENPTIVLELFGSLCLWEIWFKIDGNNDLIKMVSHRNVFIAVIRIVADVLPWIQRLFGVRIIIHYKSR